MISSIGRASELCVVVHAMLRNLCRCVKLLARHDEEVTGKFPGDLASLINPKENVAFPLCVIIGF